MVTTLSLDMSLSRAEFLRMLPAAVGWTAIREEEGVFRGGKDQQQWTLRLVALEDRRLGSVALARHQVEISLDGYSEAEAKDFLTRFHRGFHRGGG